jgi:pimeloyl-ACP methyl ester carboxylesterase
MPNAHKVVIAGAGHMSNMEQPNVFNSAVLNFLRA